MEESSSVGYPFGIIFIISGMSNYQLIYSHMHSLVLDPLGLPLIFISVLLLHFITITLIYCDSWQGLLSLFFFKNQILNYYSTIFIKHLKCNT